MYNITFQQLEMFMEVAQKLNISVVASEAYISQAALSKMIRRLEDSLGIILFNRTNRGLTLTDAGEYIYSHLRYPVESIFNTVNQAKKLNKSYKKQIKIGLPSTFDASIDYKKLKEFIVSYEHKHPDIEFTESMFDFVDLKRALYYSDVDIAFIHNFLLGLDGTETVSFRPVCFCRTFIAMSADHPLAKYDALTGDMLTGEIFYGLPVSSDNPEVYAIKNIVDNYGFKPKEYRFVPNFASLLRTLRSGKGVAISGYFSDATKDFIKYFDFPGKNVTNTLNIAWHGDNISPVLEDFINSFPLDPRELTSFDDIN